MKVIHNEKIDSINHNAVTFLRVEINDLLAVVKEVYESIANLAWIDEFKDDFIKDSFMARARVL